MPLLLSGQGVAGVGTPPPASPAAPPELKPEDLCTVEGQIFNASTAEPVRKATLRMMRADFVPSPTSGQPPTYTTSTDAAGRFAMKDIDPGKYRLMVERTGFVGTQYGARGPLRPGTILTLDRGKKIADIVFRLTPHAVVTGRVVDEDGDPVANSQVQLARTSYAQGKKQLSYANGAQTNDLGEYRIFGVAPGKYYLAVNYRPSLYMNSVDRSAAALSDEEYVPTYYPGTTELSAAAQIDVPAGGQLPSISMKLVKMHTMRVRGHVSQAAISGRANISLMLLPRSNDSMNMMMAMNRSRPPDAKGNFELTGVAPGSYFLRASVNSGEKGYSVRMPVDVGNTNVENLNVIITPGIPLTGNVRVESDTPQDLTDTRVLLRPRDTGIAMFSMGSGAVRADGAFKVDDISPDQYTLTLFGMPDGFYVKTVRLGQTEVPPSNVDLSNGAAEPLSIVVSPKAGQISGAVQNPKTQQAMPGASVVLIPQAKERTDDFSFYKTITTDQFGNFAFKSLPPGDYKVFAWEDLEPGAYYDPEFVKPVDSNGEKVAVTESGKHAVQVTMIPADAPAQNERGNSRQN